MQYNKILNSIAWFVQRASYLCLGVGFCLYVLVGLGGDRVPGNGGDGNESLRRRSQQSDCDDREHAQATEHRQPALREPPSRIEWPGQQQQRRQPDRQEVSRQMPIACDEKQTVSEHRHQ